MPPKSPLSSPTCFPFFTSMFFALPGVVRRHAFRDAFIALNCRGFGFAGYGPIPVEGRPGAEASSTPGLPAAAAASLPPAASGGSPGRTREGPVPPLRGEQRLTTFLFFFFFISPLTFHVLGVF
jgi:hypothetical protein